MLKHYSIKADIARDGSEAIDVVKELHRERQCGYDLIMMDIDIMPVMSGIETIK